jgi:hypothetical protein
LIPSQPFAKPGHLAPITLFQRTLDEDVSMALWTDFSSWTTLLFLWAQIIYSYTFHHRAQPKLAFSEPAFLPSASGDIQREAFMSKDNE